MADLGDESRDLLRAGRGMFRPSPGDRERVTSALGARLGPDLVAPLAASSSMGVKGWTLRKLIATSSVVAFAGVGIYVALSNAPSSSRPASPVIVAPPAASAPVVEAASAAPALAAPPPVQGESRRGVAVPRDFLSDEVAILSRATGALRAGRAAEALKLLDEHGRRFPRGALSEERAGARIQALCALGRRSEAEAQLQRFARAAPRSPHLGRARAACGMSDGERTGP